MQALPEALAASNSLKNAGSEMEQGRDAFQESDLRCGNLHGQRAHKQLLQARRELEAALRQAGANQINKLADQAACLSAAQAQAAEKSQERAANADPSQDKELREQQKQVQQATEQLSRHIQQVRSMLEEDYPEASQALRAASQQAEQRGLRKKQTRAGNALLYKQFEAAAKEQRDAAGYARMIAVTTQLNTPGPELAALDGVHALTDVTGFGLAGHALEIARGAQCVAQLDLTLIHI